MSDLERPGGKARTGVIVGAVVVAVLIGALVVFLLVNRDDNSVEDYVTTRCTEFSEWSQSLSRVQQEFTPQKGDSPEEVKADLDAALGRAISETAELESELRDLQAPDVENGEQAHKALVTTIAKTKIVFEEARLELAPVAASDEVALTKAFTIIGADITAGATKAFTAFSEVESPELEEIERDVPQCEALN